MIEHCYCGQINPHAHTRECEKPRVRAVGDMGKHKTDSALYQCKSCGAMLHEPNFFEHRCSPTNGSAVTTQGDEK